MRNTSIKYGDIFLVDFGTGSVGHEYQKRRPALVVQSSDQIKNSSLLTVLPFSTKIENAHADDIVVEKDERNLLLSRSVIKVHSIMSFDYQRVYHKIGELSNDAMNKVKEYLRLHFDL